MTAAQQYPSHEQPPEFMDLVAALGNHPPPCRAVDPNLWYEPDPERAIRLCGDCHARQECLDYARACGERYGVWGGANLERRQRPRRKAS